ncbi:MAG TPA: type II toxin-antitoxin system HicA family toxin [Spirochaetota bacterium]|nr:type II toxin-antitoxin system HicA family toxin [Spirochaetota bacterium]HNU91032.1 type II toxin-antitoxin system HicA family toxin [Spirochaetota bacterium]HPV97076.1 type II toxin-antitoxin system HicA family toxin [Spirochaetota bacterium]
MTQFDKLLHRILSGRSDENIGFDELRSLIARLGFNERIKGDHYIFYRDGVSEIINIQPKGGMAKPYQVKQVRNLILKYKLGETHE